MRVVTPGRGSAHIPRARASRRARVDLPSDQHAAAGVAPERRDRRRAVGAPRDVPMRGEAPRALAVALPHLRRQQRAALGRPLHCSGPALSGREHKGVDVGGAHAAGREGVGACLPRLDARARAHDVIHVRVVRRLWGPRVQLCSAYAAHVQRGCSARHLGVPQSLHHADVGAVKGLVEGRLCRQQLRRLGRRRRQRRRARARDADGDCGGGGLCRRIGDVPGCGLLELAETVAHRLQRRAEQLVPTRRAQGRAEGAPAQGEPDPRAWLGVEPGPRASAHHRHPPLAEQLLEIGAPELRLGGRPQPLALHLAERVRLARAAVGVDGHDEGSCLGQAATVDEGGSDGCVDGGRVARHHHHAPLVALLCTEQSEPRMSEQRTAWGVAAARGKAWGVACGAPFRVEVCRPRIRACRAARLRAKRPPEMPVPTSAPTLAVSSSIRKSTASAGRERLKRMPRNVSAMRRGSDWFVASY
eukprot:scaffold94848_cov65-Phaeocystis_antarctica.AAC.12